jgi:hypothetical protein
VQPSTHDSYLRRAKGIKAIRADLSRFPGFFETTDVKSKLSADSRGQF